MRQPLPPRLAMREAPEKRKSWRVRGAGRRGFYRRARDACKGRRDGVGARLCEDGSGIKGCGWQVSWYMRKADIHKADIGTPRDCGRI